MFNLLSRKEEPEAIDESLNATKTGEGCTVPRPALYLAIFPKKGVSLLFYNFRIKRFIIDLEKRYILDFLRTRILDSEVRL